MGTIVDIGFDYAALDPEARDDVREAAVRIRLRMARTAQDIVEIGRDLIRVKSAVGHGGFGRWIEAEFGMSQDTAQRFMSVAKKLGDKIPHGAVFEPSALYALAAPNTSPEVVEEAIAQASDGVPVTKDDIAALKEEWASERRDLKRRLEEQRDKAQDAKATKADVLDQLGALQKDLAALRDERDTLKSELERKQIVAPVRADEPLNDLQSVERQVGILMSAWNKASPEARERFLARVERPVMDRRFA